MNYEAEIEFARQAAIAAGENAKRIRAEGITAEAKADASPVTIADRANESLLRDLITARFPQDGILGEEGTCVAGDGRRRWIVDPIDGTRDFVRGNRFWCVLIALEEAGEAVLGVAHFPMLAETYWAVRGYGAFRGDERLNASKIDRSSLAVLSPNGLFAKSLEPFASRMMEFLSRFWAIRSAGGALDAVMVAAGQMDVWIEGKAESWDLAPLQVILEEAGAKYLALDGSRSVYAGHALAFAPGLEAEVRGFFGIGQQAAGGVG